MPLSHFRRHTYQAADVDRVLKHLKIHGKITQNDLITRPLPKPKRKGKEVVHDEPIPWVRPGLLKGSFQAPDLPSGPKGKHLLYGREDGDWKRIVPTEEVDDYLRGELLSSESRMPLSRDSAHYYLQKRTIGISRRRAYAFLEKQSVIQKTRNIPNERKKGGKMIEKRGDCEMDLIEGQGRDLDRLSDNWYWLSLVDRLTGYGVVELVQDSKGSASKKPRWVVVALKDALKRLEAALKTKVHTISSDAGREFYTDVKTFLSRRGTIQKTVPRGGKVEQFNQHFQRNFYRLMRLKRGSFAQIELQAEEITNNLVSKYTKLSPADAVQKPDSEIAAKFNAGRQPRKRYKGKEPQVGDKCRVLVKHRKNIRPTLKIGSVSRMHKTYLGRHWAKGVFTIQKKLRVNAKMPDAEPVYRYFVQSRWRDRDELLLVSGVDSKTEAALRKK